MGAHSFDYRGATYYLALEPNAWEWFKGWTATGGESGPIFDMQFGTFGTLHVIVFADSNEGLEGAIEEAAALLADEAPGHIMEPDSEELADLYREAFSDLFPEHEERMESTDSWFDMTTDREQEQVREQAEADLTYTESGYLTSYEWGVAEVFPGTPLFGRAFWEALQADPDNVEYIADYIEEEEMSDGAVSARLTELGVSADDRLHIWGSLQPYLAE